MVKKKDQATKSKKEKNNDKPKDKKGKKEEGNEEQEEEIEKNENEGEVLDDVEQSITELRQKAKEDPEINFSKELRKIQDKIADAKGQPRRPITAKPSGHDDDEEEEEEEEEDPDAEVKELINKRLTTCMLLALSFENDENYPRDFYEKLAESTKFQEVVAPISKEEVKIMNNLLKEKKKAAKERVKACEKNS